MDYKAVEKKWQDIWDASEVNNFDFASDKPKYYILEMFSYPSASNLHLGHWYNYGPSDTYARFKKMQGYNVFHPMGFDSFGLPAENFAIKTGIHPKDSTEKNIQIMLGQLKSIGAMYDKNSYLVTSLPEYYKWTQWLFLQLFKKGLAYQKKAPVNWCTSCNTVIANEQVLEGSCERCNSEVVKKELTQWFLKITAYSEELLACLDGLDWPDKTKAMQRNWIGKSEGAEINFQIDDKAVIPSITEESPDKAAIKIFTTRADTLFGVTYVVLAPEHPLVSYLTKPKQKKTVTAYIADTAKQSEIERLSSGKEKTGVFTGSYCINPVNKKKIPIYIGDYCLATYGTGAVMAVPAHDERDFEFAKKYELPIIEVIQSEKSYVDTNIPSTVIAIKAKKSRDSLTAAFTDDGILINSDKFDGLTSAEARQKIVLSLKKNGSLKVNYRLRDWSVSRQRYWGAPIPVIHCRLCGAVPVPESDLPAELPYNVEFTPDGGSPLAKCGEFMNVPCPKCGIPAKRDPDTLDTFVCSSWYFLRYIDAKNNTKAFDPARVAKLVPVDKYVGGAEHACMHLLYARFFTKALRDIGYINFDEPFKSLVHQGVILGKDGQKMSKSRGNVVNPDIYVNEYGSDVFRLYLMFGFSFIEGGPWNDDGIKAMVRFLERVERITRKIYQAANTNDNTINLNEVEYILHSTIKAVTEDLEIFSFNTAIARLFELVNAMYRYDSAGGNPKALQDTCRTLILLLAPFAPHFCEELWEVIAEVKQSGIFTQNYPKFDTAKLVKSSVEVAVQVNSRVKCKIITSQGLDQTNIEKTALADPAVIAALDGKTPKKIIVIPDRLINIVV